MNNIEILDNAKKTVNGERQDSYGSPERNFKMIAELWTVYLGTTVTAKDVGLMMGLFKIARCRTGVGSADSFIDLVGYAALAGEIATEEKNEGN